MTCWFSLWPHVFHICPAHFQLALLVHRKLNALRKRGLPITKAKELVSKAPCLRYFEVNAPVVLQVDASKYGLGAALLQPVKSPSRTTEVNWQPVAFSSSSHSATQQRSAQIEKETLGIVHAFRKFDQLLFGKSEITVHSDHKSLQTIFKPLGFCTAPPTKHDAHPPTLFIHRWIPQGVITAHSRHSLTRTTTWDNTWAPPWWISIPSRVWRQQPRTVRLPRCNQPLNKYTTPYLATMAFPTLFHDAKGDPTIPSLNRDVPFSISVKHFQHYFLMQKVTQLFPV